MGNKVSSSYSSEYLPIYLPPPPNKDDLLSRIEGNIENSLKLCSSNDDFHQKNKEYVEHIENTENSLNLCSSNDYILFNEKNKEYIKRLEKKLNGTQPLKLANFHIDLLNTLVNNSLKNDEKIKESFEKTNIFLKENGIPVFTEANFDYISDVIPQMDNVENSELYEFLYLNNKIL